MVGRTLLSDLPRSGNTAAHSATDRPVARRPARMPNPPEDSARHTYKWVACFTVCRRASTRADIHLFKRALFCLLAAR